VAWEQAHAVDCEGGKEKSKIYHRTGSLA
jgi:hypothetical protein